MFESLLSEFTSSPHGANAVAALQQQGFSAEYSNAFVQHGLSGAAASMAEQTSGHPEPTRGFLDLLGGQGARTFLIGLTTGIISGAGVKNAVENAAMTTVGLKVGQSVAERTGLPPAVTSTVTAVLTPFIIHYIHDRLTAASN